MFCHICFSGEESDIAAICSLSADNSAYPVKIRSVGIASNAIASYYRIFSGRRNFTCGYSFSAFYARTEVSQSICFPFAHISNLKW